jgi:hypothetical protein
MCVRVRGHIYGKEKIMEGIEALLVPVPSTTVIFVIGLIGLLCLGLLGWQAIYEYANMEMCVQRWGKHAVLQYEIGQARCTRYHACVYIQTFCNHPCVPCECGIFWQPRGLFTRRVVVCLCLGEHLYQVQLPDDVKAERHCCNAANQDCNWPIAAERHCKQPYLHTLPCIC